jgi:hypothetical protein
MQMRELQLQRFEIKKTQQIHEEQLEKQLLAAKINAMSAHQQNLRDQINEAYTPIHSRLNFDELHMQARSKVFKDLQYYVQTLIKLHYKLGFVIHALDHAVLNNECLEYSKPKFEDAILVFSEDWARIYTNIIFSCNDNEYIEKELIPIEKVNSCFEWMKSVIESRNWYKHLNTVASDRFNESGQTFESKYDY